MDNFKCKHCGNTTDIYDGVLFENEVDGLCWECYDKQYDFYFCPRCERLVPSSEMGYDDVDAPCINCLIANAEMWGELARERGEI